MSITIDVFNGCVGMVNRIGCSRFYGRLHVRTLCKERQMIANPTDFVFISASNQPKRIRWHVGDQQFWLWYWHPDKKWVSVRMVASSDVYLHYMIAIPHDKAKLYQPETWEGTDSHDCTKCKYKDHPCPEDAHCYMFRERPNGVWCGQYRER